MKSITKLKDELDEILNNQPEAQQENKVPKTINYDSIEHLKMTLDMPFNAGADENGDPQWYPARVTVSCDALSAEGDRRTVNETFTLGTVSQTEYTKKQIYNLLNTAQSGPLLASNLKDVITEALNEDVSS